MIPCRITYPTLRVEQDITTVLRHVASQEGCDDPEYDLMITAAEYIDTLLADIEKREEKFGSSMELLADLFSMVMCRGMNSQLVLHVKKFLITEDW